jgi:hypothetical protein
LIHLCDAHAAAGYAGTSHARWAKALDVVDLGHPDADAVRSRLPGAGPRALLRAV